MSCRIKKSYRRLLKNNPSLYSFPINIPLYRKRQEQKHMHIYQQKDIDYALDVLAHPERELSDEFRAWIQDDVHRELYYSLKAAHDGLAMNELPLPDVEEQWARFLRAKGIFTPPPRDFCNA